MQTTAVCSHHFLAERSCDPLARSGRSGLRCKKAGAPCVQQRRKVRVYAAVRRDGQRVSNAAKLSIFSGAAYLSATPLALAASEPSALLGVAGTVRTVCAVLSIALILLQNPQSNDASEALAKGQFGTMKQSANFLTITTWVVIAAFIGSSAIIAR